jgi:hypothetical protein
MEERFNTSSDRVFPVFPVVGLYSEFNSRLGLTERSGCYTTVGFGA